MSNIPLKIGFVGLGIMGAPMAGHLIKAGHQLFVFTLGKMPESIAASNATQCASARGVAERADIVIIMVPDTPDVEAALFSEAGIAAGLSKGKTVVDMSSISPIATKVFAQRIQALGGDYLDALRELRETYRRDCFASGIDYVALDTSMPFDKALVEFLTQRQARF